MTLYVYVAMYNIIILTFQFFLGSINIPRHIISGCDSSRIYFHILERAERYAGNGFSHILINHKNTLSTGCFEYLHTIDDIRIPISYVECRQRVPKGS